MTSAATESHPAGRRSAAKLKVREAIRREALSLFRLEGFEAVTTRQIADRAGVTQRTLFRHYATKAAILFDGIDEVELFERTLRREATSGLPSLEAVRRALRALAVGYDDHAAEYREVYAIMTGCSALHASERQRHARIDELLAQALDGAAALESNGVPSLAARTAAGAVMGFIRPIIRAWLRKEVHESMEALADRAWPELSIVIDRAKTYAGG